MAEAQQARRYARALGWASFASAGYYGLAWSRGDPPEWIVIPKVGAILLMAPLATQLGASEAADDSASYAWRIGVGLVLCAVGDACLEFEGSPAFSPNSKSILFLGGICSFLAGHVAYIFAFSVNRFKIRALFAIPLLGYACMLFLYLRPYLPSALIAPVFIYATAIGWMAVMACSREPAGAANASSSRWAAVSGAAFFIASDSVLAISKFVAPLRDAKSIVMATYFLAQGLITFSARGAGGRRRSKAAAHHR